MNILDTIVASTRKRVERDKQVCPLQALPMGQTPARPAHLFETSLRTREMAFICEIKKASPSKGVIAPHFPYLQLARQYEQAGAQAISVLTEPEFFQGSDQYLSEIRKAVSLPLLRKDFIIDPYQIYQAKSLGADAVLLICSLLDKAALTQYLALAHSLGLSCLVEAHNPQEVTAAVQAGAKIIGVNNRNLKDFTVDHGNSTRLRGLVPSNILFVSESGIQTRQDILHLEKNGINAVLIGEALMRAPSIPQALHNLKGVATE